VAVSKRAFFSHGAALLPVHVVLQLHLYWTVPRGLILVVVFILRYLCNRRRKRRDEDGPVICPRLTDRRNFSWETWKRRQVSPPPPKRKRDSARRGLHLA